MAAGTLIVFAYASDGRRPHEIDRRHYPHVAAYAEWPRPKLGLAPCTNGNSLIVRIGPARWACDDDPKSQ